MANITDLQSLRVFTAVVEQKSVSRAAAQCYISQSAVSQRIHSLERSLGQILLDRGQGRSAVVPTEAGRLLYVHALRVLEAVKNLESDLQDLLPGEAGTVTVASVYSVGLHALPPVLKPFLAGHPDIQVDIQYKQTEDVYREVGAGTVDVGLVACPPTKRGYTVLPFRSEPMVCIVAPEHAWAGRSAVDLQEFDGVRFVAFADDVPTRKLVDAQFAKAGVKARIGATSDNIETIKSLVEIGNGVSIVPQDTVLQEVRGGTLCAVALSSRSAFRRESGLIIKSRRRQRRAVLAFITAMTSDGPESQGGSPDPEVTCPTPA